jgi:hypothetical protein
MSDRHKRARAFASMGRNAHAIADLSRLLALAERNPSHMTRAKQIETVVELACRVAALARDTDNLVGELAVYQ